jgi:tetratricopeptide (TPR) repeat protein
VRFSAAIVMNSNIDQSEVEEVCASCGVTGGDDVKLKLCTACKLVKYCGVDCQKSHRPQHKRACKKRAAELRDDKLFTQPDECHPGECPICCLPLPIDPNKSVINSCCCKYICNGCNYANKRREGEQGLEMRCPYCREELPTTDEEIHQNLMKRAKANDPVAISLEGQKCDREGDLEGAFQYFTKATELGDLDAHNNLACMYREGDGVERDLKKAVYHAEEAAIGGHANARFNLGDHESRNGRLDRAMRHFIIAAKLGHDNALEAVKINFRKGFVSKEDFEAALRGHQAAVDATKSKQRDEAEKAIQEGLFR